MASRIRTAEDAAAWRLCIGCGACAWACPEGNIRLIDVVDDGIRPQVDPQGCQSCSQCLEVCPGINIERPLSDIPTGILPELLEDWGPILEVWEGYAADSEIRYRGSSGGLATALSLYCLERQGMHGVLHIGSDPGSPWRNKTSLSRNRDDLIGKSGSRYAPASPCDGLGEMERASSPCVFVGKPCDVVAVRKAQRKSEAVNRNLGLAIAIFCAGTPATLGTLEMLQAMGVEPEDVEELRYRGHGWPGKASVRSRKNPEKPSELTYQESWGGILQKRRPLRCHLCPDGCGEFADLSCADPWYREIPPGEPGRSMVLVRTQRGREILQGAIRDGYVCLERAEASIVSRSSGLYERKRNLAGRILTLRLLGIPAPKFSGLFLWRGWAKLSPGGKVRSFLSTLKRILLRKLYFRRVLNWTDPRASGRGVKSDSCD